MFFPEKGIQEVPSYGSSNAKIAIVGDFSSQFDVRSRRPFSGPASSVLESCLHNAGIIRAETYTTNLIKCSAPYPRNFFDEKKITFTDAGLHYVNVLRQELINLNPNIIVACGPAAFAALCSLGHLSMYRGYVFESTLLPGKKVIPTYHPASSIRGMYLYRYLISADFKKVKEESISPILTRPQRTLKYKYNGIGELLQTLEYFETQPQVGFDIEVIHYEVSCISFASTPDYAAVATLGDPWTIPEEVQIWRAIQRILGNPNNPKIVQNGMFDIPFLLMRNGVVVRGPIHDTMIAHSVVYPELQKGLGFLGSIYCGAQEYWKDTVKFKNIKDEN